MLDQELNTCRRLDLEEGSGIEDSAKTVRGWVMVSQLLVHDEDADDDDPPDDAELQEATDIFEEVLQTNGSNLEVLLAPLLKPDLHVSTHTSLRCKQQLESTFQSMY